MVEGSQSLKRIKLTSIVSHKQLGNKNKLQAVSVKSLNATRQAEKSVSRYRGTNGSHAAYATDGEIL
jgi:hypothetical protein